jgi:hypothetical protein
MISEGLPARTAPWRARGWAVAGVFEFEVAADGTTSAKI